MSSPLLSSPLRRSREALRHELRNTLHSACPPPGCSRVSGHAITPCWVCEARSGRALRRHQLHGSFTLSVRYRVTELRENRSVLSSEVPRYLTLSLSSLAALLASMSQELPSIRPASGSPQNNGVCAGEGREGQQVQGEEKEGSGREGGTLADGSGGCRAGTTTRPGGGRWSRGARSVVLCFK